MYGTCQIARFAAQSAEGDARPKQRPEHRADARVARERREHGGGEEEDEERPAQRGDHQRRPEIADQDVLGHVRGEELLVGELVERPDQREERHAEPEREERDPIPAGEVGAAAATQPHDGLGEEERRERRRRPESPAIVRSDRLLLATRLRSRAPWTARHPDAPAARFA